MIALTISSDIGVDVKHES